ncbi:tRNA (N(6)-L-threonylcarbamoyladenosine(37)-C(2))-methylthiotransferase MtaB [Alicyclobacillus cycloheptanicus]|uniref:Threonylcarbamoyladenosine tRNA methylthiotransferase MtaB n=1 Tax=Alicyclobacillus cycloheptanicus TaxID=1457 RepID=A0ABT9XJK5_9BACL|nr:tRNA (N(6)-L-threonylcarbamoyladenosine(37)-C(2))-methylthiotransferase MtaB [Alicyclobacillus cycloheptanicus]MDQ0190482.1 threonylcarbamoyladenosine tRNA methylthiotransferase MtaB [Alicyclobacillus cycloheptanicus]WDM00755.1 tRNA (N(6)-L-threonylcarbamoyladenosine(37)-C(2))-methylthiotransferase MtaB [Alicyclobacillus cycloheptanicus]
MPTVAFHTLGCKVNFYDTEAIWQMFKAAGYTQIPFEERADVYVVNTCTVTNTGDRKSRQMIRRAVRTNPAATVVVTGCYAQVAPKEVAAIAGVDLVVGNDRKSQIVRLVEEIQAEQHPYLHPREQVGNILKTREFEEMDVPWFEERTRANLKIQDGCNNFCTFCIIPFARGLIRSRKPENILLQARKLAAAGYREIVLTGIHTGGYGADLDGYRLAHLLRDLETVPDLYRVRISSIEASEIDDELIEVLGRSSKVCKHLHIPLQAGDNQVLKRMNRHYTVEEYADKLVRLRAALPELAITSDVIVGFPGESDDAFDRTEAFIRAQRFSQLHVFPYSARKGTAAARYTDVVDEEVKAARVERLIALSAELTEAYARGFSGRTLEVIPEEPLQPQGSDLRPGSGPNGEDGFWLVGHADNYLKVTFPVPAGMPAEDLVGQVCEVELTRPGAQLQHGTFVRQITSDDTLPDDDEPAMEMSV